MRYRLGFLLAIAIILLFGLGESEAACRVGGEYRVTGPNVVGYLTLTETTSNELFSTGTVSLDLFSKRACSVCSVGSQTLTGQYNAGTGFEGCIVAMTVRNPLDTAPERTGSLGGLLAFGGTVILFEYYETLLLPADLNLTLGIRKDALFRP